jgi:AcrR family transcriptional regulator
MSTADNHIIIKAIEVISRQGVKKTTMADIAEADGVSRQTLYNKYANKDEVLRGATRFGSEIGLSQLLGLWGEDKPMSAKIDDFLNVGPIGWYDMVMSAPDSADLIEGVNAAASEELAQCAMDWVVELTALFTPYEATLKNAGLDAAQLADFTYNSSKTAKETAINRTQLLQRLATLKASVLSLVGEK